MAEKKFVVEIDEKYVDQKKHQMVTYIIGKACIIRTNNSSTEHKKKLSVVDRPKKRLFSLGGKKKFASKPPPPPPQISNGARPLRKHLPVISPGISLTHEFAPASQAVGQRYGRWANINPTMVQCFVLAVHSHHWTGTILGQWWDSYGSLAIRLIKCPYIAGT